MRMNPTVVLTLALLTLMFGAGLTSAVYGYKLGRGALKSITQPDARPVNSLADAQGRPIRHEGLSFLKEADILVNVKARMGGTAPDGAPDVAPAVAPAPSVPVSSP